MAKELSLTVGLEHRDLAIQEHADGSFTMAVDGVEHSVTLSRVGQGALHRLEVDGVRTEVWVSRGQTGLDVFVGADAHAVRIYRAAGGAAEAGDNSGALLRGIDKTSVQRGQVLAKPGSITPHTSFEAEVYVLTKTEGGRHKPFFSNYRPQFYFRTTDVTGSISLPEGTEMCMPGDNTTMNVELIAPIAMDEGLRFAIREGGRTVGAGAVTKILS